MHNPLEQFEIKYLIPFPSVAGYDISYSNSALWMTLALATVTFFILGGMRHATLVPGRWQLMVEMSYEFISNMVRDNIGSAGKAFFPLIFTIFMFVLAGNLLGMLPYSFTYTSHIAVTFAMAMALFLLVNLIGFARHGFHYFSLFIPKGIPAVLTPMIFLIEVFSYLTRPFTLAIRLAANMMAGHIVLKIAGGFVVMMGVAGVFPLAFTVLMTGFELFVAVIQAYIFTILTCVYLNDAINMH